MIGKRIPFIGLLLIGLVVGIQLFLVAESSQKADLVVFSYDRPLQLYAFLESTEKYVTGVGQLSVIYRVSDEQFQKGYEVVCISFPHVLFYEQGKNPAQDFKPLVLRTAFESSADYIFFAVDDIVVKDAVDIAYCIDALERCAAYGFFLRLGKNLNYCYAMNQQQSVPPLQHEYDDLYSWQFREGVHDWRYPHTVDMTLYRKKDIEADLKTLSYTTPNRLEGAWSSCMGKVLAQKGLCFSISKIVNFPLNRVQHDYQNRAMNITPAQLLAQFNMGKKMDITVLDRIENRSAHMEYVPTFIDRC